MTKHAQKEQRRTQILDAAVACFARKGYYETTMDDIVREANLSKGTLYWHFKSKLDLFRSLTELWFAEIMESVRQQADPEANSAARLRMIVDAAKNSAASKPELVRALLEFYTLALRDAELKKWLREAYVSDSKMMRDLIEEGIARGEFRAVDPAAVARLTMAALDGALLHRELFEEESAGSPTLDEVADTILALLET